MPETKRQIFNKLPVFLIFAASFFWLVPDGKSTDLITWGKTGALETENNASWARMTHLKNGDWLAAYAVFNKSSESRIRVKKSTDNMRSWSLLTEFGEAGRKLDNANLLLLSSGEILLAVRSLVDKKSYRVQVYKSLNDGREFKLSSVIDANEAADGADNAGVWEPFLIELRKGLIAAFYASEKFSKFGYSQIISERISADGGATWSGEIRAVAEAGKSRPGEPNVIKLPDGNFLLFYEVCGSEDCAGHFSVSKTGIDWSGRIGAFIPEVFQNPQGIALDNQTFIVTSNNAKVIFTRDAGKSWQLNSPAFDFSSWGAFYQTSANEIALVTGTKKSRNERNRLLIRFGAINSPEKAL